MLFLLIFTFFTFVWGGSVSVCRDVKDCRTCADSYIHVLGFREECRWCVQSNTCGGPLACPYGSHVVQREPFRCPVKYSDKQGKRYTDSLGRSLFAVVMSLKADNTSECVHTARPDIGYVKKYSVECDGAGNTCSGLLAVSEDAKALYVAYRGSTFDKQILAEFLHGIAAQLGAWEKFEDTSAGVITYFHSAFYKLFIDSGMMDDLLDLKKKYPNFRVWVTGHSLGGSLASMTSLYLVKKGHFDREKVRLVTFGEPRTGNVGFAKEIENNIPFRYRVVKKNDGVTNIPAAVDPNTPLLTSTLYSRQPMHYRHLVHYDNNMNKGETFKICELSDDHGCRNLAMAADFSDHTSYFGIQHGKWVEEGCYREELI